MNLSPETPSRPRSRRSGLAGGGVVPISKPVNLLRDRAYAELKKRILLGELEPGSFLSERQVAAALKMSKTPIRAAFGRLEHEGFVSIGPQQGAVVKDLSVQEINDHIELRLALEPFVVRRIAGRLTRAQVEGIEANLAAQEECVRTGDGRRTVQLDEEYHILLNECLGNQEILRVILQARDRMFRVIQRVHQKHPERLHTNYPEHRAVFQAILAGDGEAAAAFMREHLEHGQQLLMDTRLGRFGSAPQENA